MTYQPTEQEREGLISYTKNRLALKSKEAVMKAISEILGEGDLIILSGFGIDGRQELLKALIKECEEQLKED